MGLCDSLKGRSLASLKERTLQKIVLELMGWLNDVYACLSELLELECHLYHGHFHHHVDVL